MADSQKQIVGRGVPLYFWWPDEANFFINCFRETALIDKLEASDYDSVDIVSPVTGAIVDPYCGLFEAAEATRLFTKYVDVANCTYRKCFIQVRTESELTKLK